MTKYKTLVLCAPNDINLPLICVLNFTLYKRYFCIHCIISWNPHNNFVKHLFIFFIALFSVQHRSNQRVTANRLTDVCTLEKLGSGITQSQVFLLHIQFSTGWLLQVRTKPSPPVCFPSLHPCPLVLSPRAWQRSAQPSTTRGVISISVCHCTSQRWEDEPWWAIDNVCQTDCLRYPHTSHTYKPAVIQA